MSTRIQTLGCALILACAVIAAVPAGAQETPADPAAEMAAAAQEAYQHAAAGVALGNVLPEEVYRWSRRWMEAETGRDPSSSAAQAQAHLERMRKLQGDFDQAIAAGMAIPAAGAMTRYYVAEAQTTVAFATSR